MFPFGLLALDLGQQQLISVLGAAFLLPVYRAFRGVHVEHDALGIVLRFGLRDQLAVHRHQPQQVLFTGQQLCLKALPP